jgi:hypothetical protein
MSFRKCSNCKGADPATAKEVEELGGGQKFIWCKATGPKVAGNGSTQFPTMFPNAWCALHRLSLWKLIKGNGGA